MLRIIQTYHGTGSYEGYKYVLEKYIPELSKYIEIGELEDFPLYFKKEIYILNGIEYVVDKYYDVNDTPEDEEVEKLVYELVEFVENKQERYELKLKSEREEECWKLLK